MNESVTLLMQLNTIGLSIICAEFINASKMYYGKYQDRQKRAFTIASESLAFIQGTGLELIMQDYGLWYDADNLRNAFFTMVRDYEKVK